MKNVITDLRQRGILKDISNESKFDLLNENDGVYAGFDPTATSLHLGNYIHIVNLLRFKKAGFKVYALVGGATGMIGDPSFRNSERKFLSDETLVENKKKIISQLESFGLEVIDNYEFYKNMTFLDFLKNVGKYVNINYMLAKDSVKDRLANGMTFTEFSYQLIQGYDFYYLYKNKNICVQMGGSDQWGNIVTGLDLISTREGEKSKAIALTSNLLTDPSGKKIGKSSGGGGLWLDKTMTSPYKIYQHLVTQNDDFVEKLLNWLTFLPQDEIKKIVQESNEDKKQRLAQKALAFEVISIIHGKEVAEQCRDITKKLFENNILELTMDDIELLSGFLPVLDYKNEPIMDFLVENKIVSSRREFREFFSKNSFSLDLKPLTDENQVVEFNNFNQKFTILKKGKRDFIILKKSI